MGQYWIPANLDKKEFIDPHNLASGLKLWEQLASHPGTGAALIVLLADHGTQRRGGGDLAGAEIIGRWAGDRVVIAGDYAETGELGFGVYEACAEDGEFTDISAQVCAVIANELDGEYSGDGWRVFNRHK